MTSWNREKNIIFACMMESWSSPLIINQITYQMKGTINTKYSWNISSELDKYFSNIINHIFGCHDGR